MSAGQDMSEDKKAEPRHVIAVIGAATAGSEIARLLAKRGALVVVFDQGGDALER